MRWAAAVVAWNGEQSLGACLDSVLRQSAPPVAILVVDNASGDATADIARRAIGPGVARGIDVSVVPQVRNLGFTAGANVAMEALLASDQQLDVILLLNQDVVLDMDWCAQVNAAFANLPQAGIVGAKLLYPSRLTIQHAGGYLERPRLISRHFGHHESTDTEATAPREVDFVTGAAMAIRADRLRSIGLFEEIFSPGYYEDVDLCDRCRAAGWAVVYWPSAVATHAESGSFADRRRRLSLSHRNRFIYALPLLADPAFREEFFTSESNYVRSSADPDDVNAIAAACVSVLLLLTDALAVRLPDRCGDASLYRDLVEFFKRLRAAVVGASRLTGAASSSADAVAVPPPESPSVR